MSVIDLCADWALTIPEGAETFWYRGIPLGHGLAPNVAWLNGDRSRGIARRQTILRAAVRTAVPDAIAVIVPLRALESAGIHYKTIEPVDVHGDGFTYTLRESDEPPTMEPLATPLTSKGFLLSWHISGWGAVPISSVSDGRDVVGQIWSGGGSQAVRLVNGAYRWYDARHWLGDSVFTAVRKHRREYFISSFDHQESPPLYFLSQLPEPAETLDHALELLAPPSVKMARDLGKEVIRQGDLFAIPMDVDTRELTAQGARYKQRRVIMRAGGVEGNRRVVATSLWGTAHTATEVATMPDGRQFARGTLYHDPAIIGERRPADHRRRPLGKQWHLIARNTVPINGTGQRLIGSGQ